MTTSVLDEPASRSPRIIVRRIVASLVTLLLVGAGISLGAASASADSTAVSGLGVQTLYDGASAPNALDSSQNNNTVATNDTVGFEWNLTATNDLSDGIFSQTLPVGWSWDPSAVTALTSDSSTYQSTASISSDGRTLTARVSAPAGTTVILKTLVARPDSDVANGDIYTPELRAAVSPTETDSADGAPLTVVSAPQADLAKSISQGPTALTVGGVAGYSVIYTIASSILPTSIGSQSNTILTSPFTITDTYTGLSDATATLIAPGGSETLLQSGDTLTISDSSTVTAATPDSFQVQLWWPNSVVPSSTQPAAQVSNTATPVDWTDTSGTAITEPNSSNNTANTPLQQAGIVTPPCTINCPPPANGGPATGKDFWVAEVANPDYSVNPRLDSADWANLPANQPVSQNSTVDTRFYFHASTSGTTGASLGSSNLVAYDFWTPSQQQLIDNGAAQYVGDDNGNALTEGSDYSVQYTTGTDTTGPWFDTVASAGGVGRVSGIRYVISANYGKTQYWLVASAAFTAVGAPSQAAVADTATFTSAEDGVVSAGNQYIIENTVLGLSKSANKTTVTSGGTVTYTLSPTVTAPSGSAVGTTNSLTVTDTLPINVTQVDTSALNAFWTAASSVNAAGSTVETYSHSGTVSSKDTIPAIVYTATTDVTAPTSNTMTNTATISGINAVPSSASSTIAIQQANVITETKTTSDPTIDISASTASWKVAWFNYVTVSQGQSYFVDVLPYNGDARGTNYSGTATLKSAVLTAADPSNVTIQYTTDPSGHVEAANANDTTINWMDLGTTDPSTINGITALRAVVAKFDTGTNGYLRITMALTGQSTGDTYGNTAKGYLGTNALARKDTKVSTVTVVSGSIAGTIVNDANRNAALDTSDPGLPGATVSLTNSLGTVVKTATSSADGSYAFSNLPADSYTVKVDPATVPSGFAQTFGPDGVLDSASSAIGLPAGASTKAVDFGYAAPPAVGTISGTVVNDANRSAALDPSDAPLAGVTVNLFDSSGQIVATSTTASDGTYSFDGLAAGAYLAEIDPSTTPTGYVETFGPDGVLDNHSLAIVLDQAATSFGNDFGYAAAIVPPLFFGAITGVVVDGTSSSADGLAGVTVNVYSSDGSLGQSATTGTNGSYRLTQLPAGDYVVKVDTTTIPSGYLQTFGPDGALDSSSGTITLAAATSSRSVISDEVAVGTATTVATHVDFGYAKPAVPVVTVPPVTNGNVSLAYTGYNTPWGLIALGALMLLAGLGIVIGAGTIHVRRGRAALR
jgi:hypothetical protein